MKSYSYLCNGVKGRLFLYLEIIAVIGLIIGIIVIMSGCGEKAGEASAEGIILRISEGEERVYAESEGLPYLERGNRYISGWYLDAEYKRKVEGNGIISGSRLYAKWEEKRELEGVRIEDSFFIYDGNYHGIGIYGVPEDAQIEYEGEGEYRNAGEYEIRGTVKCYGYREKEFYGRLEIGRRKIDTNGVRLEDASYVWDGEKKYIEVTGELPEDIEIVYENNGKSEVGEYDVRAYFDTHGNYEEIPSLRATLSIRERKYKVRFIEEDGSEQEIEVAHGREIEEMPAPKAKRGYRGYWSEEIGKVTEDKTVYARYEKERYAIEYELNGGEIEGEAIYEYELGDSFKLPEVKREYYEFVCWKEGEELKTELEEGEIGDRVYKAEWRAKEYRIVYDAAGGIVSGDSVETYTVESGETELKGAYRYGYEFVRWTDEEGREVSSIDGKENPRDITIYAEWRAEVYRIEYELLGGENAESNAAEYTIEDGVIELEDGRREGYVFLGWYEDAECSGERISEIESGRCEDIRLYAKWESKYEYEESGSGIRITGYRYKYGDEVEIPSGIDGKRVVGIARGVLSGARKIEIKAELEETGEIFEGCDKAEEIRIGEGIRELSEGILKDCTGLIRLELPYLGTRAIGEEDGRYEPIGKLFGDEERSETYGVTTTATVLTGGREDYDYGSGEKRYIPNSLEEIKTGGKVGGYALEGMKSVRTLTLTGEEVRIGKLALRNCAGLEEIRVRGRIAEVNGTSLMGCVSLTEIRVSCETDIPLFAPALTKAGLNTQIICSKNR